MCERQRLRIETIGSRKGVNGMEKLYYNGPILTMEREEDHPEAVLVRNGVIAAVGARAELEADCAADCEKIDLEGTTLMPALIDAHGHVSMTTQYVSMADLSSAECFDDLVALLRAFWENHPEFASGGLWGYGYDHNFLREQAHPTRDVLDRVSTEIPVLIWHASGHMGVANSKALELCGIDANTPDPEGGRIGRRPGSSTPDGYLEEAAMLSMRMLQAQVPMDVPRQIHAAQMQYIRNGITTVQDGAANSYSVELCREMANQGRLLIDLVAYPGVTTDGSPADVLEANRDCVGRYVNRFKIGGYKALLDGSPQGKTAWMSEPYENSGDYCGYPWETDAMIEQQIKQALDDNLQILVHCNGDAASEQYLNAYEKMLAQSDNPNKDHLRPVMIHCQTVREDQLDRMQALGMIPSIFVAHVYYWGDVHLKNFGERRGSRVSPVRSALERGLVYNFHTDTPVVQPNLFHSVWAAVNRVTRNGVLLGPEQRVGVYDALKGVTINAAYAYFEEDSKGSIRPGKRADLIRIDRNPLEIDPMELRDIIVLETIKDGVTIYRKED